MQKMMITNTDVEKFVRFCESDFGKSVLEKEAEDIILLSLIIQ